MHPPACLSDGRLPGRDAAHAIAHKFEQGWVLLCNGVLFFADTGELLPNGQVIAPRRTSWAGAPV